MGVSTATVRRWESDVQGRRPPQPTRRKFAMALKVKEAEVFQPGLTDAESVTIAVRNTPRPGNYTGNPMMLLVHLNVVDSTSTRAHKQDIQAEVKHRGLTIAQNKIVSGADKSVRKCADSIKANAS